MQTSHFQVKNQNKIFLCIIIFVSLFVYFKGINTPFVFDDYKYIVNNPEIKGSITDLFKKTRPLSFLSFKINYALHGLNPRGFHLFNLFLHISVGVLIYYFTKQIIYNNYKLYDSFAPLISALLFLCHPINTEVVTYVYNRLISLSTLFCLSSILLFFKFRKNGKHYFYALSIVLFGLGLLSKESAATMPLIILLIDYILFANGNLKNILNRKYYFLGYFLVLLIFYVFYSSLYVNTDSDVSSDKYFQYLIKQPWIITKFLFLFILPNGLSIDHNFHNVNVFSAKFIFSISIILFLLISSFIFFKKSTSLSKIVLFGFSWFFITLIPTGIFIVHIGERHLYLAIIGLCIIMGTIYCLLMNKAKNRFLKSIVIAIMLIHLGLLSLVTINRNKLYASPVLLWQDAISKYPDNFRAHNELGMVYQRQKEYDKATKEFEMSVKANPNYAKAYNNLGNMHFYNDYQKAEIFYKRAIELDFNNENAYVNLGNLYFINKNYKEARKCYITSLKINPNLSDVKFYLGLTCYHLNLIDESLLKFNELVKNKGNDEQLYNLIGLCYMEKKDYDKAIDYFNRALKISPGNGMIYQNLISAQEKRNGNN